MVARLCEHSDVVTTAFSKNHATFREGVQIGRIEYGVDETEFVVALVVHQDEDDVGWIGGVGRMGIERHEGRGGEGRGSGGHGNEGRGSGGRDGGGRDSKGSYKARSPR